MEEKNRDGVALPCYSVEKLKFVLEPEEKLRNALLSEVATPQNGFSERKSQCL